MDDLGKLRELRADAPEPGRGRLASIRSRLPRAAGGGGRAWLRRARRRPLGPMAVAGAAVLAIAAVSVGVRLAGGPPGERNPAPVQAVNATVVLEQAARTAESRPLAKMPGPRQWQYTKTLNRQTDDSTQTWETWHRIDDRAVASYTGGFSYEFFEEHCRNPGQDPQMCGDGKLRLRVTKTKPIRGTDPDDDDLSPGAYAKKLRELPTDPDELLRHVTGDRHWIDYPKPEKGRKKKDVEPPAARAFRVLGVYLKQQAVMPPDLEAAIYRALSKIPGVKTAENVSDPAGRMGTGVYRDYRDDPATRHYYVLEPRTYHYLGDATVNLKPEGGAPAGAMFGDAILDSGIVDEPGEQP